MCKANEIVGFNVLNKLEELAVAWHGKRLHPDTCYDYIDSLLERDGDDSKYGVCVFVEPCGNITKWADSWLDALAWWETVFRTQLAEMDYVDAGWHLEALAHQGLPDDAKDVWTADVEDAREQLSQGLDKTIAELRKETK